MSLGQAWHYSDNSSVNPGNLWQYVFMRLLGVKAKGRAGKMPQEETFLSSGVIDCLGAA